MGADRSARALAALRINEVITTDTRDPFTMASTGTVVEVENINVPAGSYPMRAREVTVLRRESALVRDYRQHLEQRGHKCTRV